LKSRFRAPYRFANSLRIDVLVLVRHHVRLAVLRRHYTNIVPLCMKSSAEKVSTWAGFHADSLYTQISREARQLSRQNFFRATTSQAPPTPTR